MSASRSQNRYVALAVEMINRHQWAKAIDTLLYAQTLNASPMVGFCAWKTGDAATEQLVYREAFAANPKDVWAINNLAAVLIDQGKFAQARGLLNRANALTPDDPAIFRNISKCTQMKLTRPANRAPTRPGSMQGQAASAESADS